MVVQLLILALALSIDALGIGLSYGFRKIKFGFLSVLVISFIAFIFSSISVGFGNILVNIFSEKIIAFISILILIILGIFIIKKGLEKEEEQKQDIKDLPCKDKHICLFIKWLGLTIQIIKTPSYCDLDKSLKIEPKEALYLGIALSIDCIGASIAISSFNDYALFFPLFIVIFQVTFLFIGLFLGKKTNFKKLDETKISMISGITLICIAFLRLIFFNA